MNLSALPNQNYVSLLKEKCDKNKIGPLEYNEGTDGLPNKGYKCTCKLQQWTKEGFGYSKKIAKQNAAMEMLKTLESKDLSNIAESNVITKTSAISKLYEYCSREKKENTPLFAEKPNEDNLFVVTCTLNDFTSEGKGSNRKIAKEMAADLCAKHFKIYDYFNDLKKLEERQKSLKSSVQLLYECCQSKKQNCEFNEKKIVLLPKKEIYIVTCKVGELETKSDEHISKKLAKMEAATLMLNLMQTETPVSSPSSAANLKTDQSDDGEHSNTDEPLAKKVKCEI